MRFRKQKSLLNKELFYAMPWHPYINILTMGVLFVILMVMARNADMELSIYVAPAWLLILSIIYALSSGKIGKAEPK